MTLRLPLLLGSFAAVAVTGCPAAEEEPVDDGPVPAITATLGLPIGTAMALDFTSDCALKSLELVGADAADVETTGLGTTSVQVKIDMTGTAARQGLLKILDEEVVADVTVLAACEDGDVKEVGVGRVPFFPATRERVAPRGVGNSSFATLRIDVERPDGFVLFHESSSTVAVHADGTAYAGNVGSVNSVVDLDGLNDDYEIGSLYINAGERGFYDDELVKSETTFNRFQIDPQVGGGVFYDHHVIGGEPGEVGVVVYDADGTVRDLTVDATPRARSAAYADGTRHLVLALRDDALVLIETDVTADDGFAGETPFTLPTAIADARSMQLLVDDGASALLAAFTETEVLLYDLDATFSAGATTFGTPTLLDAVTTVSSRFVQQPRFDGRLLLSADDGIYALDNGSFERLVTTTDTFITEGDSATGEFMVLEAGSVFVYAADGTSRVHVPDVLTALGSDVSFETGIARNADVDGYLVFDWGGALGALLSLPKL